MVMISLGTHLSEDQTQQIRGGEEASRKLLPQDASTMRTSDEVPEYSERDYLEDREAVSLIATEQWSLLLAAVSHSSLLSDIAARSGSANGGTPEAVVALAEVISAEILHSTKDKGRSFAETACLIRESFDVELAASFVEDVIRSLPLPKELADEILLACLGLRLTAAGDVLAYIKDQPRYSEFYKRVDEVDIENCLKTAIAEDARRLHEEGTSAEEIEVAVRRTFGTWARVEVIDRVLQRMT